MKLEHHLHDRGHVCIMVPKFHCEMNSLLPTESFEEIYLSKVFRHCMFAFLEGHVAALELTTELKVQKTIQVSL